MSTSAPIANSSRRVEELQPGQRDAEPDEHHQRAVRLSGRRSQANEPTRDEAPRERRRRCTGSRRPPGGRRSKSGVATSSATPSAKRRRRRRRWSTHEREPMGHKLACASSSRRSSCLLACTGAAEATSFSGKTSQKRLAIGRRRRRRAGHADPDQLQRAVRADPRYRFPNVLRLRAAVRAPRRTDERDRDACKRQHAAAGRRPQPSDGDRHRPPHRRRRRRESWSGHVQDRAPSSPATASGSTCGSARDVVLT